MTDDQNQDQAETQDAETENTAQDVSTRVGEIIGASSIGDLDDIPDAPASWETHELVTGEKEEKSEEELAKEKADREEVEACFATLELDWTQFRRLQQVAVSSESNRKLFDSLTDTIEASKSALAATKKGACLYILGHVKKARDVLSKAHPESEIASVLLGQLYEDNDDFKTAKDVYSKAAAKHPKQARPLYGLIKCDLVLDQLESADKNLEKAAKTFPDDPEISFLRGFREETQGEYKKAREHYDAVLEKNDAHPRALFRLGRYHMMWGEEERAVEFFERCAQQVPTYGNALVNLGLLYEDRNKYEDAIRCYQTVLKAIPDHHRAKMFLNDAKASMSMYYNEELERNRDRLRQVLSIPVSDFELSVRSRNCLNKMNIKTLGDLMKMTEAELLAHKNFGETSLLEVKQMLAQKGLRLGQTRGQAGGMITRTGTKKVMPKEDVLKQTVASLEFSVRSRNCMNRLGIRSVGDLIQRSEQDLLSAKNFGETSLNEIKTKLAEMGLSLRQGR